MKKRYDNPEIVITSLEQIDVITLSGVTDPVTSGYIKGKGQLTGLNS
ncbi:MAG: hypothetical protein IJS61_07580 [Firmicutes bacterium]|nr:hypothetical protein [Bacillota bacterium]